MTVADPPLQQSRNSQKPATAQQAQQKRDLAATSILRACNNAQQFCNKAQQRKSHEAQQPQQNPKGFVAVALADPTPLMVCGKGVAMTDTPITRQKVAAVDRSLPGRVTGRLRKAVDLMVWSAASRAEAAQAAGMADHSLRAALRRPHVMQYLNRELEVLRAGERPKNIHRLCEIRDAADNMPAVNAIKTLEQLDQEAISRPSVNTPTPGIVINVVSASLSPPVIDVTPFAPPAPPAKQLEPVIDAADAIFKLP